MTRLTVFFDGSCPLCTKEMDTLANFDIHSRIHFVNLNHQVSLPLGITHAAAFDTLHVIDTQGQLRTAVDANVLLWETVGRKPWLRMLRWPVVSIFANVGYRLFAKYREFFSLLLTGKKRCEGHCETNNSKSARNHE
jgi:predicted DCC family thiol-disulfide oxidoreductase YuxK